MTIHRIGSNLISQPQIVGAGSLVRVMPTPGATAIVEYARGSEADLKNGVVTWAPWPRGVVSQMTVDQAAVSMWMRVTGVAGEVAFEIDDSPSASAVSALHAEWANGFNPVGPALARAQATRRGNRLAVLGDSITAFGSYGQAATATAVGTTVTVTATNHGLTAGASFILHLGTTQPNYNGCWRVDTVVSKDVFTYTCRLPPTGPSGSVTLSALRGMGSNAWFAHMNSLLGGPFEIVVNAGVGSNTTGQCLARVDSDVIAYQPDFCAVMIGVNDLRNLDPTTAGRDRAFANIKAICAKLLAAGIMPILFTILPFASTDPGFPSMPLVMQLNDMIREFAVGDPNIILVDAFGDLVDVGATDNRAVTTPASANVLADTVHLNYLGAWKLGRRAARAVAPYAPLPIPLISSNADTYAYNINALNVLNNPLFVRSGGAVNTGVTSAGGGTTGIAESWRGQVGGSASAVVSLVPRTFASDGDALGNNQRMVITSTADNDTGTLITTQAITEFASGDEVYADFTLSLSAGTAVKYMLITLTVTVGGINYPVYLDVGSQSGFPTSELPFTRVMRTQPYKLPAGAVTGCVLSITAAFSGAGGLTMDVGRCRIAKKLA